METKQEHTTPQSGNAMIYVLIVIALFAALAFIMSRGANTAETGTLSRQQIEIDSTQILQTPMAIKQAVDSMIYGGTPVDGLDFILPSAVGYDTPPNKDKVFHPDGGGVILGHLPDGATGTQTDPPPGWYLGRFNNVEWTETTATDVVLTAYDILQPVCAKINERLTGSATIPAASTQLRNMLVSSGYHTGSNIDFSSTHCPGCSGHSSLCVQDSSGTSWSFYAVIEGR